MSFPLLFSAVRLYTERWHGRRENRRGELIELWLADGGITSNFPIYLFDSPLPTRPTFCLNLVYAGEVLEEELRQEEGRSALPDATAAEGAARPQDLIFMPRSNYDRVLLHKPLAPEPAHSALAALVGRVVSTARLWGDNEAMNMPGYRDRIVHIRMREHEGGFNLDMGKEVIDDLTERGQAAGRILAERFRPGAQSDPEDPQRPLRLNWSNHRFLRFRTFMAGLEVAGRRFAANWAKDRAAPQSLSAMLQKAYQEADLQSFPQYFGYRFRREEQADFARKATEAFLDLMQGWTTGSQPDLGFDPGGRAPRPKPGLRLRPAADGDPLADTPAVFAIEPDQDSPPGA